ncbi:MAG: hypothetical protein ACOCUO_03180, partial [archaeon]
MCSFSETNLASVYPERTERHGHGLRGPREAQNDSLGPKRICAIDLIIDILLRLKTQESRALRVS